MPCHARLEQHPVRRGPALPCLCRVVATQVAGLSCAAAGCELPTKRAGTSFLHHTAPSRHWHRQSPPDLPPQSQSGVTWCTPCPVVPHLHLWVTPVPQVLWRQQCSMPSWGSVPTAPSIGGPLHPRGAHPPCQLCIVPLQTGPCWERWAQGPRGAWLRRMGAWSMGAAAPPGARRALPAHRDQARGRLRWR